MFILASNLLKSPAERSIYVLIKRASIHISALRWPCLHGQWSLILISSNLNDVYVRLSQRAAVRDPMSVQWQRHFPDFLKETQFPDAFAYILSLVLLKCQKAINCFHPCFWLDAVRRKVLHFQNIWCEGLNFHFSAWVSSLCLLLMLMGIHSLNPL